ncbi:RNA-directed DNA polymerase [Vibrio mimicus]|nr:RNA-directed DNA polymerase [Vibrio vulnificus]EGS6497995.1 RNA-directed DNA polymerase [Vibrio parahaemolyticus]EHR7289785.1 RNA-directed DNA polymerase [Vibrio parahaemolyticus]HAS8158388.1 RNA-directed DNA polymerase [Vibrio vulnificus]HAS8613125.1 RNA-directed DNA polymerase [Vibrio vulnificus]
MKEQVKKSDYNRVLLSETAPFDVPVIFSNNWFYQHMSENESNTSSEIKKAIVNHLFVCTDPEKDFVPIKYSILKSNGGVRHLGLLHPASQTQAIELYRMFSDRVIHACSKSSYSIRKPIAISSCYYLKRNKNNSSNIIQPSTFLTYGSYNKLNKFFDSKEFLLLERKFNLFWSIDISKFFDSIYTHSISWALKSKDFAKESRDKSDFSSFFDRLMQRSNYNETNGIVIGNEVSRIFAETIMQTIDSELEKELENNYNLVYGKDYSIRRYVDDFFIFGKKSSDLELILSRLVAKLRLYKLHLNDAKSIKRTRPFITNITRAKIDTQDSISWLFNLIFGQQDNDDLKLVKKPNAVKRKFIDKIMAASYQDHQAYSVMCNYSIAALEKKVDKCTKSHLFISSNFYSQKNALITLLDIAFHLFNISPNSSNSLKLSNICYLIYKFFKDNHPEDLDLLALEVSHQIESFFASSSFNSMTSNVNSFVPIEFSNILCISKVMGDHYLLPNATFANIFNIKGLKATSDEYLSNEDCLDYFHIMTALYYAGGVDEYSNFVDSLSKEIGKRLTNLSRIKYDARICYLLLDSMSCPYIEEKKKRVWAKKFEKEVFHKELNEDKSEEFFQCLTSNTWFICWDTKTVLENLLENKDLLFGYS